MEEILQQLRYIEKMTFSLSNHTVVTFHLQRWPGDDFSPWNTWRGYHFIPFIKPIKSPELKFTTSGHSVFPHDGIISCRIQSLKETFICGKNQWRSCSPLKKKQAHGVCVKRNPGDLDMGNKKFRCWANKKIIDIQPNLQMVFSIWRWVSVGLICGEHGPW